jgi:hypothetical protein
LNRVLCKIFGKRSNAISSLRDAVGRELTTPPSVCQVKPGCDIVVVSTTIYYINLT